MPGRDPRGGGEFPRPDLQVEGQAGLGDGVQAAPHVSAQQPLRVRFVLDVMPDAHQVLAARASAQRRQPLRDVGRGEVGPADHPGDEAMARGQLEQVPRLADVGPHLDHDRGLHLVRGEFRQEMLRARIRAGAARTRRSSRGIRPGRDPTDDDAR